MRTPRLRRGVLLFWALVLPALGAAQTIEFVPPSAVEEGRAIGIIATFVSGIPPAHASLFLRPIGQSAYLPLVLRVNGNQLQGEIPAIYVQPPGVEYFLSVTDIDNQVVTFPAVAPGANPLRLPVRPKPSGFFFSAIYPDEGMTVSEARPLIHVEFTMVGGGLDPASLRVAVDDRPIGEECQVEPGEFFCPVDWDLAFGTHTVRVEGRSRDGAAAVPLEYSFSRGVVRPKTAFSLRGRAYAELSYLNVGRSAARPSSMLYPSAVHRVLPRFELDGKGVAGPFQTELEARHAALDRQEQPSPSRYRLGLKTKSSALDLGDFHAGWTDLGLGQGRLRGARAVAAADGWSVELVGAQSRRAIESAEFNSAVYARYVYGLAGRFKRGPLSLRLYGLGGQDDPGSVSLRTAVEPIASRSAGLELAVELPRRFSAGGELAFNRYEPNLDSRRAVSGRAYQLRLGQEAGAASWSATWREVGPDFISATNQFLQNDYRGVEGQAALRSPAGRGSLSSNALSYRDNIEGRKPSTFHLLFHNTQATAQPVPGLPSLIVGFGEQRQRTESALPNNLLARTLNWNAGLSHNWKGLGFGYTHAQSLYRDRSPAPFSNSFNSQQHSLQLSAGRGKSALGASAGFGRSRDLVTGNLTRTWSYALRGSTTRGRARLEAAHSGTRGRDARDILSNSQISNALRCEWKLGDKSFTRLSYEDILFSDRIRTRQSYRQHLFSLGYGFFF